MPSRIEDFTNHSIHTAAAALKLRLSELQGDAEIDPDLLLYWNRSQQVVALAISVLDRTDPALVPRSVVEELASGTANLEHHLSSYVSQQPRELVHLEHVDQAVDAILIGLAKLRVPADAHDVEGISAAVTTLRRSTGQLVANLIPEIDELQTRLDAIDAKAKERQAEIESQRGQLEAALQQFHDQEASSRQVHATEFTEAQEDRRKQFSEMQEERRAQFSSEATEQRERFATSLRERENQLEALLEEGKSKQFTVLADAQTAFSDAERQLRETSDNVLAQLAEYKRQAEELVHTTAMTGMAGGYKRVADRHLFASRLWQLGAVAAMIVLTAFLYHLIQISFEAAFEWWRFIGRAVVAGSIGVLAGYAAKQADRHQENERFNRQLELELASLGLYLAGMPEEEQHKAKMQLIERLFGQAQPLSPIQEAIEAGGLSILDILKLALEVAGGKAK